MSIGELLVQSTKESQTLKILRIIEDSQTKEEIKDKVETILHEIKIV